MFIRFRIPGGPFGSDSSMILKHFAGIGDLIFGSTLEKPKENQGFGHRTLKNLRKINVFAFQRHLGSVRDSGEFKGVPWRSRKLPEQTSAPLRQRSIYTNSRSTAFVAAVCYVMASLEPIPHSFWKNEFRAWAPPFSTMLILKPVLWECAKTRRHWLTWPH